MLASGAQERCPAQCAGTVRRLSGLEAACTICRSAAASRPLSLCLQTVRNGGLEAALPMCVQRGLCGFEAALSTHCADNALSLCTLCGQCALSSPGVHSVCAQAALSSPGVHSVCAGPPLSLCTYSVCAGCHPDPDVRTVCAGCRPDPDSWEGVNYPVNAI